MRRVLATCAALTALSWSALAPAAHAHDDPRVELPRLEHHLGAAPRDADVWLRRAGLLRVLGRSAEAAGALDRAAALAPAHAALALERASLALAADAPAAALAALERATPSAARERLRAEALERLGRDVEAADALRAAAAIASPATEDVLWRARLLERAGSTADALAVVDAAATRLPGVPALVRHAAALELALGRPQSAEARLAMAPPPAPAAAILARAPTPLAASAAYSLIAAGASWKWHAQGIDLGTGWRAAGYADAAWPAGPAPLGYGEPTIATPLPYGGNAADKWRTSYFRIHFTPPVAPGTLASLTLAANYDDGFVAYLNGVEIARRAMPAGAPSYSTFATSHEAGAFETIDASAALPLLVAGDNVLAVELHQTTASSSDLVWQATLGAATTAAVTRGPYLQAGAPDAVTVRWRTGTANAGVVRYGPPGGPLDLAVAEAAPTTEHEVRITGLAAATSYRYEVGTATETLAGDSSHVFTTAPTTGADVPVRLWVLGDSGTKSAQAAAVRDAFDDWHGDRPADLWMMLGDNAYDIGTDTEYQAAVFDMYPAWLRSRVLWPTRGNHDGVHAGAGNDYYDLFTLPTGGQCGGVPSGSEAYYAFDHGPIHFVCLDSEGSSRAAGSPMLQWLAADLAATTQPWIVAYWHHPPYTRGSHDSDDAADSGGRMRDMRQNALPLLEAAGVDLVLTGHSHSYERSFLLDEHYGTSGSLHDSMAVDAGDGRDDGTGAYHKPTAIKGAHEGAVYAVAGSSGHIGGGTLDHPVMITSLNALGSMVVDVDGERLEARFLSADGAVLDSFAIVKGSGLGVRPPRLGRLAVEAARPTPFRGHTRVPFTLALDGPARMRIVDAAGRQVRTLFDGPRAAGAQGVVWDGYDDEDRPAPAGVYFAVLESAGSLAARRLVKVR